MNAPGRIEKNRNSLVIDQEKNKNNLKDKVLEVVAVAKCSKMRTCTLLKTRSQQLYP
jgi:hypothetical protein